jgi:S1-C subfamily serine protease
LRKIPPFALFLILAGVGGSLLIIAGSIVFCIWLWMNPPETWGVSKPVAAGPRFPAGPNFPMRPPNIHMDQAADGEGKDVGREESLVDQPLLPPPRELDFASPLPKEADPPAPPHEPVNPELPPDLVQKVKRATVYLRVILADGKISQGTGFFGVLPNLILTNAHVIGMQGADFRRPQQIEVVLSSGAGDERKLTAQVVGADASADLAVLRAEAPDLPPPLPVRSARNLHETQQVYIFGFPFGAELGREITVSQSSVSSLRWEKGTLAKVQVNGGMQPGNSGGPVVDSYGNVVGVAVSILRFTQINFAVPGDQVYAFLCGRITGLSLGQPFRKKGQVSAAVALQTVDPLTHILTPALETWVGEPTPPSRPPSMTQPSQKEGDSPHRAHALEYHNQVARAEIALPPLPPGKVYWVQPRWTTPAGETWWAAANVYLVPPAVEQKKARLIFRHQIGGRPMVLDSWLDFRVTAPDGVEHTGSANAQTRLTETTEAVDAQELASVRLQYRAYNVKLRGDNQDVPNPAAITQARQNIKRLTANLRIDRQGNLVGSEVDWDRIQLAARPLLATLHQEFEHALEGLTVPLPNKEVVPGESWTSKRSLSIPTLHRSVSAHLDMNYSFLGTRESAGRAEAVVELKGLVREVGDRTLKGTGHANGMAAIDLASGQITEAQLVLIFDMEMNPLAHSLPGSGKLTLHLRRDLTRADAHD